MRVQWNTRDIYKIQKLLWEPPLLITHRGGSQWSHVGGEVTRKELVSHVWGSAARWRQARPYKAHEGRYTLVGVGQAMWVSCFSWFFHLFPSKSQTPTLFLFNHDMFSLYLYLILSFLFLYLIFLGHTIAQSYWRIWFIWTRDNTLSRSQEPKVQECNSTPLLPLPCPTPWSIPWSPTGPPAQQQQTQFPLPPQWAVHESWLTQEQGRLGPDQQLVLFLS